MNNFNKISPTFCPLAWTSFSAMPTGAVVPCCEFNISLGNYFSGYSVKDYFSSKWLDNIKQQFINGEWPLGCETCKNRESYGVESKRIVETKQYINATNRANYTLNDFNRINGQCRYVNIQLSNLCNLSCVMCQPEQSSAINNEIIIAKEENLFPNNDSLYYHSSKIVSDSVINDYTLENINEMLDAIDDVNYIPKVYITGGEPSIHKGTMYFLEQLKEQKDTKRINLEFNSNVQQVNYKFMDIITKFNRVKIMASIDSYGDRLRYMRYPSDWEKTKINILNIALSRPDLKDMIIVTPVMHILQIMTFDKVVEWCADNNIPLSFYTLLQAPQYLDMRLLPYEMKKDALNRIRNKYKPVVEYLNNEVDRLEAFLLSKKYTNEEIRQRVYNLKQTLEEHDTVRKTNWRETFPELIDFIEGHTTNGI